METEFYEPRYKDGKIVAFADVEVSEGITLKGFRVVNGDKGLFAAVPSRPVTVEGETRYMNLVTFASPSDKEAFLARLLDGYDVWKKARHTDPASR